MESVAIEPIDAMDFGPCECCGNDSRRVWGFVHADDATIASYFVHWTLGRVADHGANFDLILGRWGKGATAADRSLIALEYRLGEAGPSFMVINATGRPAANTELVGRVMDRDEVVGTPIAKQAFDIVDAILAQDARVAELLGQWRIGPEVKRHWWRFW